MNKKILTIASIVVVSILLLIGGRALQNKYASNIDNKQTASSAVKAANSDISNNKQDSSSTNKDDKTNTASVNAVSPSQTSKASADKKTITNNSGTASVSTAAKTPSSAAVSINKTEQPNFIIYNDINKTTIFSKYTSFNEGETAANVTKKTLDSNNISYRLKDGFYISSMAGLNEFKAGPSSGWCFYVNGVKSSVGASSYILKSGDKITWKYLSDGLNN